MPEWTQSSRGSEVGVDQLGMRVAGEKAYERLIDFTTTVTWRPRYFSFFCWATREAFVQAGGRFDLARHPVNLTAYRKSLKRIEYAVAAVTLREDRNADRVAGNTRISAAIEEAERTGGEVHFAGDHLAAPTGGLAIYAGVMRLLGLLSTSAGVDIPLEHTIGSHLADAFARSIHRFSNFDLTSANSADLNQLCDPDLRCSLSRFSEAASTQPELQRERDLLRALFADWRGFSGGDPRATGRLLSIGLVLAVCELLPDERPSLPRFREFTLLGAARTRSGVRALRLPASWDRVLLEWQFYQAHAFATYALESLLSLVLARAVELRDGPGAAVALPDLLGHLVQGVRVAQVQLFGKRLERWWEVPLQALQETLRDVCAESRMADIAEPELYSFLARFRGDSAAELEERAAASFLLLLLAVTRLSVLLESHSDGWVGGIEHYRLPPQVLARDLLEATKAGSSTLGYLARVLDRFVVRQHETNALRKLAAQPELDTALFILERDVFIPIANHTAGTSNPRFLNVVTFLADLGYLRIGDGTQLTADGQELLNRLRQLTASS